MDSEIMLQPRQITSLPCPPHFLPVLPDLVSPSLFFWTTRSIVLDDHILLYESVKVFQSEAAVLQDRRDTTGRGPIVQSWRLPG